MIQLELQPALEAQLAAEAKSRGLELSRYIESIVTDRALESFPQTPFSRTEAQLEQDLRQGVLEIAQGNTRPAREVFAELREEYDIRG